MRESTYNPKPQTYNLKKMSKYSKVNIIYLLQKWMDSVPGQTFLNYAYSWGAAVVILGTLFKLTHLPGANAMLFIGMGTEVLVFFLSAFDRPFDKSTIDMPLDNHMSDDVIDEAVQAPLAAPEERQTAAQTQQQQPVGGIAGGTIIIGNTSAPRHEPITFAPTAEPAAPVAAEDETQTTAAPQVITPAPAVSAETAEAMEIATTSYVDHLNELNEMLEKVAAQSARLATDSEEMENLNRTLTGISRVYEMQLKSASQQITTQDEINEQTRRMAQQIQELNAIYTRMIEAMTVNMNPLSAGKASN